MTEYHHRWLNTDKVNSLYPKLAKRGTVLRSYSDYDNISATVISNVECVDDLTSEDISPSYTYRKGDNLT